MSVFIIKLSLSCIVLWWRFRWYHIPTLTVFFRVMFLQLLIVFLPIGERNCHRERFAQFEATAYTVVCVLWDGGSFTGCLLIADIVATRLRNMRLGWRVYTLRSLRQWNSRSLVSHANPASRMWKYDVFLSPDFPAFKQPLFCVQSCCGM